MEPYVQPQFYNNYQLNSFNIWQNILETIYNCFYHHNHIKELIQFYSIKIYQNTKQFLKLFLYDGTVQI